MKASARSALGTMAACAGIVHAAAVVDLHSTNFEDFINSHAVVMTEFYAPWCGICKDLKPIYEETATMLPANKDIKFARVDCVAEPELCKKHRVPVYPTIFTFKGTEKEEIYNGKREQAAMIKFAEKRYDPPVVTLSKDSIERFKLSSKAVVIGYWEPEDQESSHTFTALAESLLDDFEFGATTDRELAVAEHVALPGVVLYKQYDDPKLVHHGSFNLDDLKSFIKQASIPLIGDLIGLSHSELNGRAYACIFAKTEAERQQLGALLRSIAERTKDTIRWVTADAEGSKKFAFTNMHLKDGPWPAFAIRNSTDIYPFDQTQSITLDSVGEFVNDYLEKKMPPHVLSEPLPKIQEGHVTIVVRDNFQDVVLDSDADVLLEFYAPWCGHCKKLAPVYERLAEIYHQRTKKVVIAKVDATANEIPDQTAISFPTIKLFPANAKDSPITHSGNRSIEALAEFVRDNSASQVDILDALQTASGNDLLNEARAAAGASASVGRDEL